MTDEPNNAAIEAAITKLKGLASRLSSVSRRDVGFYTPPYVEAITTMLEGYEAAKAAEWVKCEDAMPPKPPFRAKYLCRFSLGDYYDISVLQWWRTDGWTDEEGNVLDKAATVTHWMPLPEYTGE